MDVVPIQVLAGRNAQGQRRALFSSSQFPRTSTANFGTGIARVTGSIRRSRGIEGQVSAFSIVCDPRARGENHSSRNLVKPRVCVSAGMNTGGGHGRRSGQRCNAPTHRTDHDLKMDSFCEAAKIQTDHRGRVGFRKGCWKR